jgi:tRNA-modifying protein YgfZ
MSEVRSLARLAETYGDCSDWRKIAVSGRDALAWLNDIVSADLSTLDVNEGRRSLLLGPTGKVRASFQAVRLGDGSALLIQDPAEPHPVDGLLAPYVLSAEVEIDDRTKDLTLFAWPEARGPMAVPMGTWIKGSSLGEGGFDLLVAVDERSTAIAALPDPIRAATATELEAYRVERGIPRVGVDVGDDDLPFEAGLGHAVAFDKGCYLGQEAVARVRNLGHPRRVLISLQSDAGITAGDPVFAHGEQAGRVTSAVPVNGVTVALASVRWAHRDGPLRTREGAELTARPLP